MQQATDGVIFCDNSSLFNKVLAYQSLFPIADLLNDEWRTPFDSSPTLSSDLSPSASLASDWDDVLNKIQHCLQD
jgi:hypothetical protein